MGNDPSGEISHLRSRARKHGLAIRTRRGSRAAGAPVYSLIDRETGRLICSDLRDLYELRGRLWWTIRERRLGAGRFNQVPRDLCPECGTARVGFFRFCRSCGWDFRATGGATVGTIPDLSAPPGAPLEGQAGHRELMTARVAAFVDRDLAHHFDALRRPALGLLIGLLVGAMIALIGSKY